MQRLTQLLVARMFVGDAQILRNRPVEQICLLAHHGLYTTAVGRIHLRKWHAGEADLAALRIPIAHQQFQHC